MASTAKEFTLVGMVGAGADRPGHTHADSQLDRDGVSLGHCPWVHKANMGMQLKGLDYDTKLVSLK